MRKILPGLLGRGIGAVSAAAMVAAHMATMALRMTPPPPVVKFIDDEERRGRFRPRYHRTRGHHIRGRVQVINHRP